MKIEIKNYCIRCGICVSLNPELYAFNFEDDVIDVLRDADTPELEAQAVSSAKDCAVAAIFLEK